MRHAVVPWLAKQIGEVGEIVVVGNGVRTTATLLTLRRGPDSAPGKSTRR
jgi:hypothetical protein